MGKKKDRAAKKPTRATEKKGTKAVAALTTQLEALTQSLARLEERLAGVEDAVVASAADASAAREGMRALRDASLIEPPTREQLARRAQGRDTTDPARDTDTPVDARVLPTPNSQMPLAEPAADRWPAFDEGRISALQARLEAATPGPWRLIRRGDGYGVAQERDLHQVVIPSATQPDAHLIAHAPDDLTWLIRELRHSWGREAAWRDNGTMWREWYQRWRQERAAMERVAPEGTTRPGGRWMALAALCGLCLGLLLRR